MDFLALTSMLGVGGTTGQSLGTTTTQGQDTGFSAIIEGLMATQLGLSGGTLDSQAQMAQELMQATGGNSEIMNLLLQLLGGNGTTGSQTQTDDPLSSLFGSDDDEDSQDANLTAMLMGLGGITTDYSMLNLQNQLTEQGGSILQNFSSETNAVLADVLSRMPADKQQQTLQFLLNYGTTQDETTTPTPTVFTTTGNTESDIAKLLTLLSGQIENGTQTQGETSTENFADTLARMQLTGAVTLNSETTDSSQEQPLDLNSLQQSLFATDGTMAQGTNATFADTANVETVKNIASQLLQPMQTLTTNKNEFTVKLNPEGLGEITVKLTDTAGTLSLVLTASSTETARLLNAEMATLQSTLRPFQTEAEPTIVVQTTESETGNDYMSDNFNRQSGSEQRHSNGTRYDIDADSLDEMTSEEIIAQLANNILSTRI